MYEVQAIADDFVSNVDEKTLMQVFGYRIDQTLLHVAGLQRIMISDEIDGVFKIRKTK